MPKNPWSIRSALVRFPDPLVSRGTRLGQPHQIISAQQRIHLLLPQPSKSGSESMVAQRAAVGQLVELGHSVFHKFGRLQDEWVCILPIVIHRILTQYQDIQNYKKVGSVCHLPPLSCKTHRGNWGSWSIPWAGTPVEGKLLDQSLGHHYHSMGHPPLQRQLLNSQKLINRSH